MTIPFKCIAVNDRDMKGITNAVPKAPDAYVDATYANEKLTLKKASGDETELTIAGGAKAKLKVQYAGISDLSEIKCTITPTGSVGTVASMTTSSDGGLVFDVEAAATYKITSVKDGVGFDSEPVVSCNDLVTTAPTINCYVPGVVTVTVTDAKASVYGRVVTATCDGQTTQTKTVEASGSTGTVTFSLPAGEWTLSVDYPDGATGGESKTQTVEVNQTYEVSLAVVYTVVFGARIAVSTADPVSRVSYPATIFGQTNSAYGKTSCTNASNTFAINGWDGCALISGIKRQTLSGTTWTDVTDKRIAVAGSSSQEVYTYFPTWWFKMTNDGTNIDFAFSNNQIDETWQDYAGSVGTNRLGHFRLGCFCTPSSSAVLSYGGTKSAAITLTNAITYTQSKKGAGWDLMTWYQWTYIAALMTLMFKTTDLQAALGNGVSNGSQSSQPALTYTNDYGMYGDTSGTTTQMAFFWLQNIYGDYWQWCGGAKIDSSCRLMTCTGYSSTTDSDFDKTQLSPTKSAGAVNGAIKTVVGTTDAGFFPTDSSGSYTTYFADRGLVFASTFPLVGGYYSDGTSCGPFCANFYNSAGSTFAVRPSYRA